MPINTYKKEEFIHRFCNSCNPLVSILASINCKTEQMNGFRQEKLSSLITLEING